MAVQFDESSFTRSRSSKEKRTLISGLIIRTGIVKTEKGAKIVELILFLLLVSAIFFAVSNNAKNTPEPPTADEVIP